MCTKCTDVPATRLVRMVHVLLGQCIYFEIGIAERPDFILLKIGGFEYMNVRNEIKAQIVRIWKRRER